MYTANAVVPEQLWDPEEVLRAYNRPLEMAPASRVYSEGGDVRSAKVSGKVSTCHLVSKRCVYKVIQTSLVEPGGGGGARL